MKDTGIHIGAYMDLHATILLLAFSGLLHIPIKRFIFVFGGTGRMNIRGIDHPALRKLKARAGQRASVIQSLLGMAKLNGLNTMTWLKEILEKLPVWPNSRIDELLPLTPEQIDTIKHTLPARAKW